MIIPNIWENKIDVPNHQPDDHPLKHVSPLVEFVAFHAFVTTQHPLKIGLKFSTGALEMWDRRGFRI